MVPRTPRPNGGIRRRESFPDVGRTLSTYRYDAFQNTKRAKSQAVKETKATGRRRLTKKRLLCIVLLPFVLVGLWLGAKFIYNASKIFDGNIFAVLSTTKLNGEDRGRVNILVAGNSADDIGHNGGDLTDSIMILSIDTKNHEAFLLSVPRDLYVKVPDYGHSKINEAYVDGQNGAFSESGYPAGGMGLLEKTIESSLGIDLNYYALVNYTALRDTVDAVGGIDVTINSTDKRGLYDPSKDYTTGKYLVKLSNGRHHLNGQAALNLARARGDAPGSYGFAGSDFTRTENQRMMLLALKSKIFTSGVLANPVKIGNLSDALGNNVKTDMKLSEVRRLYDIMKDINNGNVRSYGLNDLNGKNLLNGYRTAHGQSALIPAAGLDDFSDVRQALRQIMSSNPLVRESAQIVILNATDIRGLASDNKTTLENSGMTVSSVGDAGGTQAVSRIIDASGGAAPHTLAALKKIYGQRVTIVNDYAQRFPKAQFIVVVGQDKVPTTQ